MFGITALKVLLMISYGVPGYLLVKSKHLGEESIKAFAKVLLYVCSPALSIYNLSSVETTEKSIKELFVFFALSLVAQVVIILVFGVVFKKRMKKDAAYKLCAVTGACGNVGFFGMPLLEYLLPNIPSVRIYSAAFSITMNIIGWTLGLLLMTGDRKYIKLKAVFINPSVIAFSVSLVLFVFDIKFPALPAEYIETFARMSTVVCMTVLGMRLATKKLSTIFSNYRVYIAAFLKLVVFPIVVLGIFYVVPVDETVRTSAFILACCPAATMLQSLAETHGGDGKTAADIVLATSILCIFTIPLMWTLYSTYILA